MIIKSLLVLLVLLIGVIVTLYLCQNKLLYQPCEIAIDIPVTFTRAVQTITYTTSDGQQFAYFIPASEDTETTTPYKRLWVCFQGNQGQAGDYGEFVNDHELSKENFLLIEYPGYGKCQGKPSRKSIIETLSKVMDVFKEQTDFFTDGRPYKIGIIAYSLGTATSLEFASIHSDDIDHLYLICPFTSLREMARQRLGWPLCTLLHDNFESLDMLKQLCATGHITATVFGGTADHTVPYAQEQAMGSAAPGVEFISVHDGNHWTTYLEALTVIAQRIKKLRTYEVTTK